MRINLDVLKLLYKIQSKSNQEGKMIEFLSHLIPTIDKNIVISIKDNNIYVTKGISDTYPTIVAHTDQVQNPCNTITIIEHEGYIFGFDFVNKKQVGLGADDKNGIYIALLALQEFPVLKAAFFCGEEIGCVGSKKCDLSFFDNSKYVIQCDRKGDSDFIIQGNNVDLSTEEFEDDCQIEKFGYKQCNGFNTDVVALKERGLKVSCCNISCGYYNPHHDTEITKIEDLNKCWKLTKHILSLSNVYPHVYIRKPIQSTTTSQTPISTLYKEYLAKKSNKTQSKNLIPITNVNMYTELNDFIRKKLNDHTVRLDCEILYAEYLQTKNIAVSFLEFELTFLNIQKSIYYYY